MKEKLKYMWLYDLLLFMDATVPIKVQYTDGSVSEIPRDECIKEDYKHYYVQHITLKEGFLWLYVEIRFEMKR